MIDRGCGLSLSRQCELLDVSRSSQYYEPILYEAVAEAEVGGVCRPILATNQLAAKSASGRRTGVPQGSLDTSALVPETRLGMSQRNDDLVSMNFRVPLPFKVKVKLLAAGRGTTMTRLLYEGFALVEQKHSSRANGDQ